MDQLNKYRVYLDAYSMTATYTDGYVDVVAGDEDDAVDRAFNTLLRPGGNFHNWGRSMFQVRLVERRW